MYDLKEDKQFQKPLKSRPHHRSGRAESNSHSNPTASDSSIIANNFVSRIIHTTNKMGKYYCDYCDM